MHIATLSPFVSVAGQIRTDDISGIAGRGFRTIINNRPDREAVDQPPSEELRAAAEKLGLEWRHIPVVSGNILDADVDALAAAMDDVPGPVLMFCRSGTRSAALWALYAATHLGVDAVLDSTSKAGYDLTALAPRLRSRTSPASPVPPGAASKSQSS